MELEEHAADPLSGGILGQGYQCGMLWGAALAAGAQAYREYGAGAEAETEAVRTAQRLVGSFRAQNDNINCADITQIDLSSPTTRMIVRFLIKSGPTGSCLGMAARYAKVAFEEIEAADSQEHRQAPCSPSSCAALLAQKMGASDMHTVMAARLAGGIGLSGGACGALGAAVWLIGLKQLEAGDTKIGYDNPEAQAALERFLESADYEFECEKIVGRKFESVADHAAYVRDGGCSKLIEALANSAEDLETRKSQ